MINEPKYDGDLTTKSYVDRATGALENKVTITQQELETSIGTINKTYGAAPNPPYFVGNLYVDGTNLYRCKTERLIGSFDAADWELATAYPTTSYVDSTYTKPEDFAVTGRVDVNGGRITAGSISSAHYVANTSGMRINLDNDTIDAKNFKLDSDGNVSINGALTSNSVHITGGNLNIGSGNFVVTNAGVVTAKAINIEGGTMSATNISGGSINVLNKFIVDSAGNLTATNATIYGNVYANNGTFNGTIYAGGSSTFAGAITANGSINISRGGSYFRMGLDTHHPYCSGLNVAGGINFSSIGKGIGTGNGGFTFSSAKLYQVDEIHRDRQSNGNLLIKNDYNDGSSVVIGPNNLDLYAKSGASVTLGANVGLWGGHVNIANGIQVYSQSSTIWAVSGAIGLRARGTSFCWAANGTGTINGIIKTTAGDASSLILKKNLEPFNNNIYEHSLKLLEKINLYNYDLKYGNDKSRQYGFIIDELENIPETSLFFKFQENVGLITKDGGLDAMKGEQYINKKEIPKGYIRYKNYDSDYLIKYLLTVCKAQQMKLDELEVKINER